MLSEVDVIYKESKLTTAVIINWEILTEQVTVFKTLTSLRLKIIRHVIFPCSQSDWLTDLYAVLHIPRYLMK